MTISSRSSLSAAIALVLATMSIGTDALAQPAPSSSTPTAAQIEQRADLLKKAARLVRLEIDKIWDNSRGGAGGYNSIGFTDDSVIVRWKGAVPANVQAAIDNARTIAPITVQPVAHSRIDLKTAARQITDPVSDRQAFHTIWAVNNNSLLVEVAPGRNASALSAALPVVDVPVEVVEAEPIKLSQAAAPDDPTWEEVQYPGRWYDIPRFSGGSRFQAISSDGRSIRHECTTGFGVYVRGIKLILTAAHCVGTSDWIRTPNLRGKNPPNPVWMGNGFFDNRKHDLALVWSPGASAYIWDGPSVKDHVRKKVADWDYIWESDSLCQSGTKSGTICNLKPTGRWAVSFEGKDSDGNPITIEDLVELERDGGGPSSQHGDSGGPVYLNRPDGKTIVAKGISSAVNETLPERMYVQDFATVHRDFRAVPIVSP